MKQRFLDTNVLLRHLLNDEPQQSRAARALIQAIEDGAVTVWTTDLVIAEIVFVLSSRRFYNLAREEIRARLLPLINLAGIKLQRKRIYSRVFELYTSLPIDYIDCYHAALIESRKERELFSFDEDFDRVPEVTRVAPGRQPSSDAKA